MNRLRKFVIVALLAAIGVGGVVLVLEDSTSGSAVEVRLPDPSLEIEVRVSGEVSAPGVYVLDAGARVADAIKAAGGLTPDAHETVLNLAKGLRDGDHIHVMAQDESSQRVSINTADEWLLDALPGIGETIAARIVAHRSEQGPFMSPEEIKQVKGISDATYEKIKDLITVY